MRRRSALVAAAASAAGIAFAQGPLIDPDPPTGSVLASARDTVSFRTARDASVGDIERALVLRSRSLGAQAPLVEVDALDPRLFHLVAPRGAWPSGDRLDLRLAGELLGFDKGAFWFLEVPSAFRVGSYPSPPDQLLPTFSSARDVRLGDFDGDDIADALVLAQDGIAVFWGRPCAGDQRIFDRTAPYSYSLFALGERAFLNACDLDNNGADDILLVTETQPERAIMLLARDPGTRQFRELITTLPGVDHDPMDVKPVHLDNDPYVDLLFLADANNLLVPLRNVVATGEPFFEIFGPDGAIQLDSDPLSMTTGDFSVPPDGYDDVVVSALDRSLEVFENVGGRQIVLRPARRTVTNARIGPMASIDFDQNGLLDIVAAETPAANRVRRFMGVAADRPFRQRSEALGIAPLVVRVVDLDGDQYADPLFGDGAAIVTVDRQQGERVLATGLSSGYRGFELADLNCDGAPDLLAAAGTQTQVRLNHPRTPGGIRGALIEPQSLFDEVELCVAETRAETLCVLGAFCPVDLSRISLNADASASGAYALDLIRGTLPATLNPGDTVCVELRFTPLAGGAPPGAPALEVVALCDSASVPLGGEGLIGELDALPPILDFGELCPPEIGRGQVCFFNAHALCGRRIVAAWLEPRGEEPCPFTLIDPPGGVDLEPGERLCIDVDFAPPGRGRFDCDLRLALDQPLDTLSVPLAGRCNNPPFWYSDPVDLRVCEADTFPDQTLDYRDPDVGDGIECLPPEWLEGSDTEITLAWDCARKILSAAHPGGDYIGWARYRLTITDGIDEVSRELRYEVADVNDPPLAELEGAVALCADGSPASAEGVEIAFRLTVADRLDHLPPPAQTCESTLSWAGEGSIDPPIPGDPLSLSTEPEGSVVADFRWTPGFDAAGDYRIELIACEDDPCPADSCNPDPVTACDTTLICFTVSDVAPDLVLAIGGLPARVEVGTETPYWISVRSLGASWPHQGASVEVELAGEALETWQIPPPIAAGDSLLFAGSFTPRTPRQDRLSACLVLPNPELDADPSNNCDEVQLGTREGRLRVRPNPFTPNGDGFNDRAEFVTREIRSTDPRVTIFDLRGRTLRRLRPDLEGRVYWDGRDDAGAGVDSGVYLYLFQDSGGHRLSGQITVAR